MTVRHLSYAEIMAGLPEIEGSPRERGTLSLIVRRPSSGQREVLDIGTLDVEEGLLGDRWALGKRRRANQLTVINARFAALLAQSRDRWPLAGDQLYVDFDLSAEHVPPGTRIAVGDENITLTLYFSTMLHQMPPSGLIGSPSYITVAMPLINGP